MTYSQLVAVAAWMFAAFALVALAGGVVHDWQQRKRRTARRQRLPIRRDAQGWGVQSRPVAAVLAGSRSPDAGPCSSVADTGVGAVPRLGAHSATTD